MTKLPTIVGKYTLSGIQIIGEWSQTESSENFLHFNDGEANKIICFGSKKFFEIICNSECIFMDGTFYSAPKQFLQLYTSFFV